MCFICSKLVNQKELLIHNVMIKEPITSRLKTNLMIIMIAMIIMVLDKFRKFEIDLRIIITTINEKTINLTRICWY